MKNRCIVLIALLLLSQSTLLTNSRAGVTLGASIDKSAFQTTSVNQTVEFTATPIGGTPPYTFQWCIQLWTFVWGSPSGNLIEVPGATSPIFKFAASNPGTYEITLKMGDSAGSYSYIVGLPSGIWVIVQKPTITSTVSILSPENTSYSSIYNHEANVPLTYWTNTSLSWVGYSLDGGNNVTAPANGTMIEIPNRSRLLTLYANDTAGNWAIPQKVYYSIAFNLSGVPEPFPWLTVAAFSVAFAVVAMTAILYVKKRNHPTLLWKEFLTKVCQETHYKNSLVR